MLYVLSKRMVLEIKYFFEGFLVFILFVFSLDRVVWKGFKKLSISGFFLLYYKFVNIMFFF